MIMNNDNASDRPLSVPSIQLPEILQQAAARWPDWGLPVAEVTIEHVARWGTEAKGAAADIVVRFLRFGEVYAHLPTKDKKPFREAAGMSKTWACDAARAFVFVMETCEGHVPAEVSGPRQLVDMELAFRRSRLKDLSKTMKALQEEKQELLNEQFGEPEGTEKVELHPLVHHLLGVRTILDSETEPVPSELVVLLRELLRLAETRIDHRVDGAQIDAPVPTAAKPRPKKPAPQAREEVDDIGAMFGIE